MKHRGMILAGALAMTSSATLSAQAEESAPPPGQVFTLHPIGQVQKADGETRIVLDEQYAPGLLGLDGFSHVYVFWWFDRNDTPPRRAVLQVHPRGDRRNPLTGVFATRSPCRPNLIAMTLCKIVAVEGNMVEVEKIDAFDGTPVLDMKPMLPGYDTCDDATVPDWIGRRPRTKKEPQ